MTASEFVREALRGINDPCSVAAGTPIDLISMGLVEDVQVAADGNVHVAIRLTSPTCVMVGWFRREIQRLAGTVEGVRNVEVTFDTGLDWEPSLMAEDVRRTRAERLRRLAVVR